MKSVTVTREEVRRLGTSPPTSARRQECRQRVPPRCGTQEACWLACKKLELTDESLLVRLYEYVWLN